MKQLSKSVFGKKGYAMRYKINTQKENKKITEINKGGNGVKWTDVAMVLITAFLAYYTWQLFNTAITQTDQAIKMAQSAHTQDSIARLVYSRDSINNADTKIRENRNSIEARIRDSTTFAQQSKSINAQIKSIEESQKQFVIGNMPYLQCEKFKIVDWGEDKDLWIKFNIINIGNHTAKIFYSQLGFYIGDKPVEDPFNKLKDGNWKAYKLLTYVTKEYPSFQNFHSDMEISKELFDGVNNGTLGMQLFGNFAYVDETTKGTRMYSFNVSIEPPPSTGYTIIQNINATAKKP